MRNRLPNPWIGVTYIPDNVRMETPPAFFLQQIHDYDADLVMLPSRQRPFAYVLARRKRFSAGLTDKAIESTVAQDTVMCFQYGLVPVSLLYKTGPTWNADTVLRSLRARDLWAHGGADAAADLLEAQEEREKQTLRQEIRDDMWNRSGDAYRSYKFRTGSAVSLAGARTGRRIPKRTPSGSTAGSGALFINEQA